MEYNELKLKNVSNLELVDKMILVLSLLRPDLPGRRLKDCCSGAMALLFELSYYFEHNEGKYGDYEK